MRSNLVSTYVFVTRLAAISLFVLPADDMDGKISGSVGSPMLSALNSYLRLVNSCRARNSYSLGWSRVFAICATRIDLVMAFCADRLFIRHHLLHCGNCILYSSLCCVRRLYHCLIELIKVLNAPQPPQHTYDNNITVY